MAKRVALAFGIITVKDRSGGEPLHDSKLLKLVETSLASSVFRTSGRKDDTKRGFMPPEGGFGVVEDQLLAYFAYEHGTEFDTIDEETKEFVKVPYPKIPYQGRVLFVITPTGDLVMQRASTPYLEPSRLMEALQEEVRRQTADDFNVTVRALEFHETYSSTVQFINELSELSAIKFVRIRHSNPESRDEKMDKIADMNVDELIERSSKRGGINRDSPEFAAQLGHAKSYAQIERAEGQLEGEFTELVVIEGVPEVTIAPEAEDELGMAKTMTRALRKIRSRLRRKGPEAL
jgi:hypothetical protein